MMKTLLNVCARREPNPDSHMKATRIVFIVHLMLATLLGATLLNAAPLSHSAFPPAGVLQNPASGTNPDMVEWNGFLSRQKEEYIHVVTTREEWSNLWKRAFDQPAPALDFERYAVACIFLGHSAPWLFSIHVGKPQIIENTMIIPYYRVELILELSGPFKAAGQYHMEVFERRKGYALRLEEQTWAQEIRPR
jgi:hypothetical protein